MNILLFILFVGLMAVGISSFIRRAPRYGPAFLLRIGLILLLIFVVYLALTGRLHWLIGLAAGLLPFLRKLAPLLLPLLRLLPVFRGTTAGSRPSAGQQSEICTRWLRMTLDHDSGEMQGEILAGPYQGRTLQELSIEELEDFYLHCRTEDSEAIRLLDSWIQRYCADEWNTRQHQRGQTRNQPLSDELTTEQAWEILGLEPGASIDEIHSAHKRMMARVHPDKGGSNYLASKINQARDLLIQKH